MLRSWCIINHIWYQGLKLVQFNMPPTCANLFGLVTGCVNHAQHAVEQMVVVLVIWEAMTLMESNVGCKWKWRNEVCATIGFDVLSHVGFAIKTWISNYTPASTKLIGGYTGAQNGGWLWTPRKLRWFTSALLGKHQHHLNLDLAMTHYCAYPSTSTLVYILMNMSRLKQRLLH